MRRLRPIHRTKGDPAPAIDHWLKWPLVVLLVLFVAALFWAREQAETLLFGLRLLNSAPPWLSCWQRLTVGWSIRDQRRFAAREIAQSARPMTSGIPNACAGGSKAWPSRTGGRWRRAISVRSPTA